MKHHLKLLCVLILGFTSTLLQADIQRMEPSCWWVGMQNPVFQILLYGDQIGSLDAEIADDSVTLESVTRAESPNYLFLYVRTHADTQPGDITILLRNKGKTVETLNFPLLKREEGSAQRAGFDSSDVVYLITPDRFSNGNPANDSIAEMNETEVDRTGPYKRHGGDLQGIIDHLDYLQTLGVTAIWINPIQENNQLESSYHGYAVTDFYKIDSRFGDNELYSTLVAEAKKRGIKTIMDQIFNQCGSEHWWMKDLPFQNWINFSDAPRYTNHVRTTHQDPYASVEDFELHTRGWFVHTMPDMNLSNPLFADYMIQNSIWWVEYAGLSGIRQDTYCYPDKHTLSRWCKRVMEEYPNLNITGEEWSNNPLVLSYWQKGKINADGYEGNLPSLIDFPINGALKDAFGNNNPDTISALYLMLANDHVYPNAANNLVFMSNHDMPRFYMEAQQDPDWYRNALVFLCTTRGIPQLYAGDEILLTHTGGMGHGYIRRDIPGGWSKDRSSMFESRALGLDATDAQTFTRKLLNWRKNSPVVHTGKLTHFAPQNGIYVYFRHNDTQTVMCILNKNPEPTELDLSRFQRLLQGKTQALNVLDGAKIDLNTPFILKPKQPMVMELS